MGALDSLGTPVEVASIGKELKKLWAADQTRTRATLIAMADGDGRYLLTLAEALFIQNPPEPLDPVALGQALQKRSPAYDKDREEHYNLISALHKSIRGSDPDAALYWLARMLTGEIGRAHV